MRDASSNIVLIGMPGAGKSTVGVVLAKVMNKSFVDTDLLIQQRHGKTLQDMIDKMGSEDFIACENEVLRDFDAFDTVIATGGSAVYSNEGMQHLRDMGTVVYLCASANEIAGRIEDFDERGIVFRQGCGKGLSGLLEQRGPLYEKFADKIVAIDGKSVTETVRCIVSCLEERE